MKATLSLSNRDFWIRFVTWLLRIGIGGVFIFSGFVKAIDPYGTLFKLEDYCTALGISVWPALMLTGVFVLCALEFATGVFLMTGSFRRSAPWVAAAFMLVMLPLTLWIAIADPVADCGCFGDAFVISNWATFWKNVVLSAGILFLLRYNRNCACLINPYIQWLELVACCCFIFVIGFLGYEYQPLLDFRPYRVGTTLLGMEDTDNGLTYTFIYEKDGVRKEFTEDEELPDESEGWKFVERREKPASGVSATPGEDKEFRIWSEDGLEDVTEEFDDGAPRRLFLLMPNLGNVSVSTSWLINSMYTWAGKHGVDMVAVVSGDERQIAEWKDISMSSYPIYTADDTSLKELARGNPAVVYVEDGKIVWKSTLAALESNDFLSSDTSDNPADFAIDDHRLLVNISLIFIAVILALIGLSFSPLMGRFFLRATGLRKRKASNCCQPR